MIEAFRSKLEKIVSGDTEGRLEAPWQKIVRHVLTGDFDPETIKRGLRQIRDSLSVLGLSEKPVLVSEIQDYGKCEGCTVRNYGFKKTRTSETNSVNAICSVATFSSEYTVLPLDNYRSGLDEVMTSDWWSRNKSKIAGYFVGPTVAFIYNSYEPNNGYFTSELGLKAEFMDTNPPGQRRGALLFSPDSTFRVIDDKEKWEIVNSGFINVRMMTGCSFFIRKNDSLSALELKTQTDRGVVSYLVQYTDMGGRTGFAHFTSSAPITRRSVKLIFDREAELNGWTDYLAAELEYRGGGSAVLSESGTLIPTCTSGYYLDDDHPDQYFLVKREYLEQIE